jgi:hypothetical protein
MKLFRIFMVAALAIITSTSVQAGVVFSNMGNSGTLDTSGETSVNIIPSRLQASGFTSGSTDQRINRISIVAETLGAPELKTLAIYYDNAGSPGRLLGKSSSTLVDAKGVYQFDFSGPQLVANTSYWMLPEDGMRWYYHGQNLAPTARNNSGFSGLGSMKESLGGLGGPWTATGFNGSIAIDSVFVPEPGLTSLLCLSGIALIRRRIKK